MDEIKEEDNQRVLQQIYEFASQFERNQFVINCRIAAQEYHFDRFTEVENYDFNLQQIGNFASNWFSVVDPVKSERFMQKLQENESIQEIANDPLLLTLLCLMFQETAEFPWNRLELYQEGTNLLLKKWDSKKNVERYQVYKNLSVQQKQDLLSQIAFSTFERNEYFFKQQELEQYIADYISNLACVNTEKVLIDSLSVIKSIELQHGLLVERARGIYSFSHLTFQEYFTARQIAICSHPQVLETALQQLVSRITEKRWREVFLLTVEMLRNADYLVELMKQKIEQLVAEDRQLQAVLRWGEQKARSVNLPLKQVAIRYFYISLVRTLFLVNSFDWQTVNQTIEIAPDLVGHTLELAFSLDNSFALNQFGASDLIIDSTLVLTLARAINLSIDFTLASEFVSVLDLSINLALEPRLKDDGQRSLLGEALLKLQQQLPNLEPPAKFIQWWQTNGKAWTEQLRSVTIDLCQIGYDWQLDDRQREKLRQYCYANQLLLDCLKSDCYITRDLRSQIEETLLLPVAELQESES